jgi:hypothetical protein
MNVSHRRIVTTLVLAAMMLGGGAAAFAYETLINGPQKGSENGQQAPGKKGETGPRISELARERLKAAHEVYTLLLEEVRQGKATGEGIANWSPHLLAAELDVATTEKQRITALQAHVDRLKDFEQQVQVFVNAGRMPLRELARARCLRLEAELQLAKQRAK